MSEQRRTGRQAAEERRERHERRLQNLVFVGAIVVLALVLSTSFMLQHKDETPEGHHPTAIPRPTQRANSTLIVDSPHPTPPAGPAYPPPSPSTVSSVQASSILQIPERTGILDPLHSEGNSTLQSALFLGLTMPMIGPDGQPTSLAPLPVLLESWEISADRRKLTLHLHQDIFWVNCSAGDGQVVPMRQVIADDVMFAIERALRPETLQRQAILLYPIEGVQERLSGDSTAPLGIESPEPFTLHFTFTTALLAINPLPSFLSHPVAWPLPREPIEAHGDAWTQVENIWVNGAYCPIAWTPGQEITLVANPWLPSSLRTTLAKQLLPLLNRIREITAAPYP